MATVSVKGFMSQLCLCGGRTATSHRGCSWPHLNTTQPSTAIEQWFSRRSTRHYSLLVMRRHHQQQQQQQRQPVHFTASLPTTRPSLRRWPVRASPTTTTTFIVTIGRTSDWRRPTTDRRTPCRRRRYDRLATIWFSSIADSVVHRNNHLETDIDR